MEAEMKYARDLRVGDCILRGTTAYSYEVEKIKGINILEHDVVEMTFDDSIGCQLRCGWYTILVRVPPWVLRKNEPQDFGYRGIVERPSNSEGTDIQHPADNA